MIRLRYDIHRDVYVDDMRNRLIENRHVSFLGTQQRVEKFQYDSFHQITDLDAHVQKLLKELFSQRELQPNAYSLTSLDYFFTLDFLFAPDVMYISLCEHLEEVAK